MGNQKVRATTLQQKFGFQDDELRTPAHDALMVWLDQYVDSAFVDRYPTALSQDEIDSQIAAVKQENEKRLRDAEKKMSEDKEWMDGVTNKFQKPMAESNYRRSLDEYERIKAYCESWNPGQPPSIEVKIRKIWESPVMARNDFMVGFIDMKVLVKHRFVRLEGGKWDESELYCVQGDDVYLYEIKPSIPSVGELIRQIRMYQQYQDGHYTVVSPDDRFASVLNGQGIEFLKAPNL